ncbi:MAG: hypothetical protein Q9227_002963 [Pyrenula ochraceoflavens]
MEFAAGVVGFIGLTGQILQGCNYLSSLFSNAKESPKIIQTVSLELQSFTSSLSHFKGLLVELEANPHLWPRGWHPEAALKSCDTAVTQLKAFVHKFPELHDSGNAESSKHVREKWQRIMLAKEMAALQRYLSGLQHAKYDLELLQSNIGPRISLRTTSGFQQQLKDVHKSTTTMSNNSTQLQEMYASTTRSVQQLSTGFDGVRTDIAELKASFTLQSGELLAALSRVIDVEEARAIEKHSASLEKEKPSQPDTRVFEEINSHADDECTEIGHVSRSNINPTSRISDAEIRALSTQNPYVPKPLIKKSPKKQRSSTSSYNIWLGRIIITTTETTQEDLSTVEYGQKSKLLAKRFTISIIPNLLFSTKGAIFATGSARPAAIHPLWDNRLRVFRTHSYDSRLRDVLKNGNYLEFRNMLDRREVTPFDQLSGPYPWRRTIPLFYYMMRCFCENIERISSRTYYVQGVLDIARLLVGQGIDCGEENVLEVLGLLELDDDTRASILDLYYLIISHSETDPFDRIHARSTNWIYRRSLTQEEWDTSELQEEFEVAYGRGSWSAIVIRELPDHDWARSLRDAWSRKPSKLRRSRKYCLKEFGYRFTDSEWPALCWNEQTPPFWRSREQCKEVFGDRFMRLQWPRLFWKRELPPFWRSRKQCEEFFDIYFVYREWPNLYWKQELPAFWRSRKQCAEFFDTYFADYDWPNLYWKQEIPGLWYSWEDCKDFFGEGFVFCKWARILGQDCFEYVFGQRSWDCFELWREKHEYSYYDGCSRWRKEGQNKSIQEWRSQNPILRHSRPHNLAKFGYEFFQQHFPKLLKEDGLTAEEIENLTKDGPDLYCRPPQWPRENKKRSWDDDEHGNRIEDEDEDGNWSDASGWETADEEISDEPWRELTVEDYA